MEMRKGQFNENFKTLTLCVNGCAKKSVRIVYAFIYSTDFLEVITWAKILFQQIWRKLKNSLKQSHILLATTRINFFGSTFYNVYIFEHT